MSAILFSKRATVFLLVALASVLYGRAALTQTAPGTQAPQSTAEAREAKKETQSVAFAQNEKAIRYSRRQYIVYFGGVALDIAIYASLWLSGFGVWLRRRARRASRYLFVRCVIFVPVFWVVASVVRFPLDYYAGYAVEHRFDLSTQNFPSWLGDWGKTLGITALAAIVAVWILYRIIRSSPRRWWAWFWLITLPLSLLVMFGAPYIIEPLFNKFTPLEASHPALTARIERMVHRAGINIPESRIFKMNASAKTRALNAYVSGVGHSKRVVVWDTTLMRMTPDETLAVLAHETGHYVLHHILKEFALDALVALGAFLLGFVLVCQAVRRWGRATLLEGTEDLASFPLLMLILTLVVFLASPLYCGVSRHYEHQADQYGLELLYGVVQNPNESMVGALRVLGKDDLSDPHPNPFIRFWLYTHPPLDKRIQFASKYHPWTNGKPMKLLHTTRGL
ncbi:MAG: M48 family metallopeptidase [Acidobacteriota bacterium]|nr:M48 family metallopeptidase [Acidobacteriota bacterium]